MTARSGKGTARQTFRIEQPEWDAFGVNTDRQGTDRSAVLRAMIRWYNGEPDAALPERPKPRAPE